MLAVLTQYNSSHGEAVALVLLTEENAEGLVAAVDCARDIESLGYTFGSDDIGAYVVRMPLDIRAPKNAQDYVFIHRFYNKKWTEEWVDDGAQSRYLKAKRQPA